MNIGGEENVSRSVVPVDGRVTGGVFMPFEFFLLLLGTLAAAGLMLNPEEEWGSDELVEGRVGGVCIAGESNPRRGTRKGTTRQ